MNRYRSEIQKMADRNVSKWALGFPPPVQPKRAQSTEHELGPFLAISREAGAGGSEIAKRIGSRMHWDVVDSEILNLMAEKYGTPRALLELVDEKPVSWLEEVFERWIAGREYSPTAYFQRLGHLVLLAARHGNVVFVGRGAQFLLPHGGGLSIRIVAPQDYRVNRMCARINIGKEEARKIVQESDRNRRLFIKEHFHRDITDPNQHDLVINLERLGLDGASDLAVTAMKSWLKKSRALVSGVGV